jgi:hypothetical protein
MQAVTRIQAVVPPVDAASILADGAGPADDVIDDVLMADGSRVGTMRHGTG